MLLKIGQELTTELDREIIRVEKYLGGGGQGEVYIVSTSKGNQALKWYNARNATEEQKNSIRKLIIKGPPKRKKKIFIWPADIATMISGYSNQFGYIMPLIERNRYA